MAESLDMSLDDIIKNNKRSRGGGSSSNFGDRGRLRDSDHRGHGRGRGVPSGPGPTRRNPHHVSPRSTPYFVPQALLHMEETVISGDADSEAGTKLYISNLDYGVTNDDIKVLFSEVGELKRYSIHYDKSGRSKGTAEVVFIRQSDALAAMNRYNNVQLDGVPMKLEVVGVRVVTPVAMPTATSGLLGRSPGNAFLRQERNRGRGQEQRGGNQHGNNRVFNGSQERGRGGATISGSSSSKRGGGGNNNTNEKKVVSAADLDAELERYHLEAMEIN